MYAQAVELSGRPLRLLTQWALLQFAAGNDAGYRAACDELLDRYGDTKDPFQAFQIALTCAVAEHAVRDMQKPLALARLAAGSDPRNPIYGCCSGIIQYRTGNDEDAIAVLRIALPLHAVAAIAAPNRIEEIRTSRLVGEVVLAIAYHRAGKFELRDKQVAIVPQLNRIVGEVASQVRARDFRLAPLLRGRCREARIGDGRTSSQ